MKTGKLFFTLLIIVGFSSCKYMAPSELKLEKNITDSITTIHPFANSTGFRIDINNSSDSAALFYLTPLSIDFRNYETLIQDIVRPEMSDKEKAIRLWKFSSSWTVLGIPPARNQQTCDPLKLFISLEYALCGGINGALSNLFTLAGLRSRVYSLYGHVVAEVFYCNAWHMFDADRDIYFTNNLGEVASVDYISKHPEIIAMSKDKLRNWGGPLTI
jgi:hypothetical protein